ncbi:MAG: hypothetical protein WD669_02435 [Pirellulales bacterium]
MKRISHYLRQLAGGGDFSRGQSSPFAFQSRACGRAFLIVRLFYAANLFLAGWRLAERARWNAYDSLYPLWPLWWADGESVSVVATKVFTANAFVAVLAALFPTNTMARWLAFAGALVAGALENSFGSIGHGGHAWVWAAFFFAFLPTATSRDLSTSRLLRQRYLQTFWTAQFAVLFFYSMSGWLKLVTVPIQLHHGEVCALAPEALARHIANRILQTNSEPWLAAGLIDHPALSWLMYLGALYLEAFAVIAAFRPALHRFWGGSLILLHLGIGLAMEIWFVPPMFLLALLFVSSPFQRDDTTWRETLGQLPGVKLLRSVSPKGTFDKSPAIYRWVRSLCTRKVP